MARTFVAASSMYAEITTAPVTANPITVAAFFYPTSITAGNIVASIGDLAATTRVQIGTAATTGAYTATQVGTDAVAVTANGATSNSINVWGHCCGVFASSTSRTVYRNGVSDGTDTVSKALGTPTGVTMGTRYATGTRGFYANGRIAELAIYNVSLTAPEILSLSNGCSPLRVRPDSLVFYAPTWGEQSPEINQKGTSLSLFASPTKSDHPRVYY